MTAYFRAVIKVHGRRRLPTVISKDRPLPGQSVRAILIGHHSPTDVLVTRVDDLSKHAPVLVVVGAPVIGNWLVAQIIERRERRTSRRGKVDSRVVRYARLPAPRRSRGPGDSSDPA